MLQTYEQFKNLRKSFEMDDFETVFKKIDECKVLMDNIN